MPILISLPERAQRVDQLMTDAVPSVQEGNQRDDPRAKGPWRDLIGPFRWHPDLTAPTDQGVVLVCCHLWRGQWKVPHLLAARQANGGKIVRQRVLTPGQVVGRKGTT